MRPSNNIQNHARHRVALILALAGLMCGVTLMPGLARLASAQAVAPSWSYTGSGTWSSTGNLNTRRFEHTATLLPNGKVLVAGGVHCDPNGVNCIPLDAAELYDPAAGTWSGTGNLNIARHDHTATLLPNGN